MVRGGTEIPPLEVEMGDSAEIVTDTSLPFEELVAAVKRNSPRFMRRAWYDLDTKLGCPLFQVAEREAGVQYYPGMGSGAVYEALSKRYDVDLEVLSGFIHLVDSELPITRCLECVHPIYHDAVLALFNAQPGLADPS